MQDSRESGHWRRPNLAGHRLLPVSLVSIADRGIGIAPEDLPHVFERFYEPKSRAERRGLGLGMYIAKMLVEAHGGQVWLESEVEKGTTFYVSLPLA